MREADIDALVEEVEARRKWLFEDEDAPREIKSETLDESIRHVLKHPLETMGHFEGDKLVEEVRECCHNRKMRQLAEIAQAGGLDTERRIPSGPITLPTGNVPRAFPSPRRSSFRSRRGDSKYTPPTSNGTEGKKPEKRKERGSWMDRYD